MYQQVWCWHLGSYPTHKLICFIANIDFHYIGYQSQRANFIAPNSQQNDRQNTFLMKYPQSFCRSVFRLVFCCSLLIIFWFRFDSRQASQSILKTKQNVFDAIEANAPHPLPDSMDSCALNIPFSHFVWMCAVRSRFRCTVK